MAKDRVSIIIGQLKGKKAPPSDMGDEELDSEGSSSCGQALIDAINDGDSAAVMDALKMCLSAIEGEEE